MPARPAGRQMWRVLLLLLAAAAAGLLPTDPRLPTEARPPARPPPPAAPAAPGAPAPPAPPLAPPPDPPVPFPARDAAAPDWTLAVLNARAAWNVSVGAGAVVVTPDCGADWTHPDLARVDGAHALNAVEPAATALPTPTETHGTMVASTVVAADDGGGGTGGAPGGGGRPLAPPRAGG